MLTPRQNFLETIHGGHPDRFVNQFDFMVNPFTDPYSATNPQPWPPEVTEAKDLWGITWMWPEGVPGAFPRQDSEHLVIQDITRWQEAVHAPSLDFPEEVWQEAEKDYGQYDRNEVFVGPIMFPGLLEYVHSLMGMIPAMEAFLTEPDSMHELIEYITDWECRYVKLMAARLHPDIVWHHADWGSSKSTFLSPDMFAEFFLEPYKRLYRCYHDNGFEIIIHHSDCYAATLVPYMIEMGIDVWQGGVRSNHLPELIRKYGGQISFMSGIDSSLVDCPDWSREKIAAAVKQACDECGTKYFIPCQTQGSPMSTFEEVAPIISEEISKQNARFFPAGSPAGHP